MLKNWIRNEQIILNSVKGSRRLSSIRPTKYPLVKNPLYSLFEEARLAGRLITHCWFLRHAKSLYRELYLERYLQDAISGR
jgi:hypothetical protein